ncbi:uncharacterized protein [Diadema setosum]|uniref:uncharacterized protein n=1 Tax=Diadema setosum TaxID=31175 RepID=UPI003B39FAC6
MSSVAFCTTCLGKSISLSDANLTATRTDGFNNGITFSDRPIPVGEKVTVEIRGVLTNWSGSIRYGFTNHAPGTISSDKLPPYAMPNLSSKPGYWCTSLSDKYNKIGNTLTYYITKEGSVYAFVNNNSITSVNADKTSLDVKKPIWFVIDVYGNTNEIRVKGDAAPAEILARGPDAMLAFEQAANSGTKPIFRTRLMLVGQDRVGKTSLKRSLTGQRYNIAEVSTDGIDTMDMCEINVQDATGWQVQDGDDREEAADVDDSTRLHTTYIEALALNIAKVLWKKKKEEKEPESSGRGSRGQKLANIKESLPEGEDSNDGWITSASDTSSDNHEENSSSEDQLQDLAKSLDQETFDLVTSKVERFLTEAQSGQSDLLDEKEEQKYSKKIVLSIWDFAGQSVYYTTHQVFLSPRAVYVIVFSLSNELDAPAQTQIRRGDDEAEYAESEFTNLDFMDFWMRSIHAHTAENRKSAIDGTMLSPPVFVVGTHRNSLAADLDEQRKLVAEKFNRIQKNLVGKPYLNHIIPTFYAVENNIDDGEDEEVVKLRRHIEAVAGQEPYMGEHIPLKWLWFQKKVADFLSQGINYMSLDSVTQCAASVGVTSEVGVQTMLQFYHDLGVIIYYGGPGASDSSLRNTVILRPQWLVDIFRRVITIKDIDDKWSLLQDAWSRLDQDGVLQDNLLDHMWEDVLDQKDVLIGLMEKFDLLCERVPPATTPSDADNTTPSEPERTYFVPSRLRECPDQEDLMADTHACMTFFITFGGFLPDGLFHRILTRVVRWSQEQGGREPRLFFRQVRFFVNDEHDALIEMAPARFARIKITVLRVDIYDEEEEKEEAAKLEESGKEACAKVHNFLFTTLADLRRLCMKRVRYEFEVACPCNRKCAAHKRAGCSENPCLHFLKLGECLSRKIVMCEQRRIRTNVFQKWFPSEKAAVPVPLPVKVNADSSVKEENIPSWVRVAAKLLNSGSENADWLSLAYRLGYKKAKIQKLTEDEPNPALCILLDWFQSSGNTALSVEMLLSYLEQMKRDDVVDVVQKGQDVNKAPPTVFISYNWGIQEEVRLLRDFLERTGFPCWMDIGQMGGGDVLYSKIYEGIHNAKVVLCCITPQYIMSDNCNREISLADQLKKPIIPIIYKKVPWPPPGSLALIVSQLIYVTLDGVGGHGGSGAKADLQQKYQDIITQIRRYTKPVDPTPAVKVEGSDSDVITANSADRSSATPRDRGMAVRSPSRGGSHRTQSLGSASLGGGGQRQPQLAAVTKCAICTIL